MTRDTVVLSNMKGLAKDKVVVFGFLVTLLALQVSPRSLRGAEEKPRYLPDEGSPLPGNGDLPKKNRINKLVNIFEKKFVLDDNKDEKAATDEAVLSKEEQEMIKKRILDGLGLTSIPTRNLSNIPAEEIEQAYEEYSKAVRDEERRYQSQLDEEGAEEDEEESDDEEDDNNRETSTFRFLSTRVTKKAHGRGRRSVNDGQQIVHFSVSLPTSFDANISQVIEAKSMFWKRGISPRPANATSSTIPVSFYRLDDIPRGKFRYTKLDPIYIATKNVSIYGNEWVELDMTNVVKTWMNSQSADTGVLIKCPDCDVAGIKFLTGGHRKGFGSGNKVPRLDVRTETMGLRRVKRSRKMRKSMKRNMRHHSDCHDATHPRGKRSNRCCRRSMQVRFADLPRFDFILSPKEFDAYYCSGKCPARYNPANEHALLQSLLNLRGKNNVPGPCCAPTKLKGLNILHIGDNGRIKTTFWRDVIVTECGCA